MKQFVIAVFLSSLIISFSQAQRGWRLFNQFGWVMQIHQSANHSLWVASFNGVWRLHNGTWQKIPHASAFVFEDNAGAIWSAGPNSEGLWRYDTHGWHQISGFTGLVQSLHRSLDGTLWVGTEDTDKVWWLGTFAPQKLEGGLWR